VTAPPPPAGKAHPPPVPSGVHQVGSREWTVSSDLAETWKDKPGTVGRARKVDDGWQLYGITIRQGYNLGLRNGDVITEVNGHELNTKLQQVGAWLDLRNDDQFEVRFLRGGQAMTYTYRIVR
jgi:S1-C subfamily serine protease